MFRMLNKQIQNLETEVKQFNVYECDRANNIPRMKLIESKLTIIDKKRRKKMKKEKKNHIEIDLLNFIFSGKLLVIALLSKLEEVCNGKFDRITIRKGI